MNNGALFGGVVGLAAAVSLAGCNAPAPPTPAAPTGQVVATVYGEQITRRDLDAALNGGNFPDAAARKAAQLQALSQLIQIKVLARAAHQQGLDNTSDFALQKRWALAKLAAQALMKKAATVGRPASPQEVKQFISNNPDMYARRKVFTVNAVLFAPPSDPVVLQGLGPIHTLDRVKAALDANHIANKEQQGVTIDAARVGDPHAIAVIRSLRPHALLMFRAGQNEVVVDVLSTQIEPLPDDQSTKLATARLSEQYAQQARGQELNQLFNEAKPHVQFNADFKPAAPTLARPDGAPRPTVIVMPDWGKRPDQSRIDAAFPVRALRHGVSGWAELHCTINIHGLPKNCTVDEDPKGMGFGAAALSLRPTFLFKPSTRDGVPIPGHAMISIRFHAHGARGSDVDPLSQQNTMRYIAGETTLGELTSAPAASAKSR